MSNNQREFTINIKNSTLVFRTTSYRAEKGSMLHSGIYNRELTSSLVAGSVLVAAAIAAVFGGLAITPLHYVAAVVVFVVLFVLLRVYLFFETYLQAVIDKSRGEVSIFVKGIINKRLTMPLGELTAIRRGYTVLAPENIDGVKVIEKIALQHGTVIPGFGKVREYYTVNLEFRDGETPMIFSSEDSAQTDEVLEIMNRFVGGKFAPKD